jgi:hypothetical protein
MGRGMRLLDLFSKRQRRLRGDVPDIYVYDQLPNALRVQIVHVFTHALGEPEHYEDQVLPTYKLIADALCKEYGLFVLPPTTRRYGNDVREELGHFFLTTDETEKALDVVELVFRVIDRSVRRFDYNNDHNSDQTATEAIEELNARFKEAGVGFQYLAGEIVRVDSELIHSEVTKPALRLLNTKHYAGAQQEFLAAHEHYRNGKMKEALNDCLKSFESTMKAICDKHRWPYGPQDTASKLLQVCFDQGLVPAFWQGQLSSLRSLLESSVPTGRNRLSGHGQGTTPTEVPGYIAAYMLHMTASALVFLTTADLELK